MTLGGAGAASATLLTSKISMDNGFDIYISTSDSIPGTLFGSHNNWPTTYTDTTILAAGTSYFLHVFGYDQGGIAGFLGEFTLSGADHKFANNLTTLLTNTTYWMGNQTGFNGVYGALNDLGGNGAGPWGTRPGISSSARWVWAGDPNANDFSYFSTAITAVTQVPLPGSLVLLLAGALGLRLARRPR